MVVEIEQEAEEVKLVVICRMCNLNFTPGPYQECPYHYDNKLGVHVPLCGLCREVLRSEQAESS